MKTTTLLLFLGLLATAIVRADIFDFFKSKPAPADAAAAATSLSGLTEEQMIGGLKEALSKGVQQSVSTLGKADGFLADAAVKIPMPESLQKVEKTLRAVRQDKLADDFVATMNRAAEQAVPQAATVLGESVKKMSVADAKAILTGTNNAATMYFRKTSETNLYAAFLPIVRKATDTAGVTSAYKGMVDKASAGLGGAGGLGGLGGGLGGLGNLGGGLVSGLGIPTEMPDLDGYVTHKALDGLFLKIAEQEKLIRSNPVARTTDLLKSVFGSLKTPSSP